MDSNIQSLILKVDEYKKSLQDIDYIHDKARFFYVMRDFIAFLTEESSNFNFKELESLDYFKENKSFFIKMNLYFIRALEAHESMNILSKNYSHSINSPLELLNAQYIKEDYIRKWNDLKNVDLSWEKTLVMVGCWPFPETILYMYENTPLKKVIWLDYSNEAIYMAWEIIRFLWFEDITLRYHDGCTYDYKEADIVYIASFVELKEEIIEQVIKTWKKTVQILLRQPAWLNEFRYPSFNKINNNLEIVNNNKSSWYFHSTEMLKLQRKDRNA